MGAYGDSPPIHYYLKEKGIFLKLHGSLNWLYCPNPICPDHYKFWVNTIDDPKRHTEIGEPCDRCGSGFVPVIIPPAMGKSFEKFPKMGFVWNQAFRKIKGAKKLILIGLSFPESDYYLRWLIRQARLEMSNQPEVIIVNPCNEDAEKTCNLLGISEIECERHQKIEDYSKYLASV
ncbi:MAG: hypothetical protein O2807_11770 [bacterium]|nr:hypothetical protein [bacterium]